TQTDLAQHRAGADQRQTHQRGGIVGLDGVEQHDAQTLALGASGAVIRLLEFEVALDLVVAQLAKMHAHRDQRLPFEPRRHANHRHGGVKTHRAPAHRAQLLHRAVVATWLAERLAVEFCDLIRANHRRVGVATRHGSGFAQGEALRQHRRGLAGQRGFVDTGSHDLERQLQPQQQFAPIGRRRRKDQATDRARIVPLRASYTGSMAPRRIDPRKLDVAALAADAARLEGEFDAQTLQRWREMQSPPADVPLPPVHWTARGEQRKRTGEALQHWLRLQVTAEAWPICQRCLQPFSVPLHVDRVFRVVATEADAEALDADSDDDVLAPAASFDLIGLIEDELVLAWP